MSIVSRREDGGGIKRSPGTHGNEEQQLGQLELF